MVASFQSLHQRSAHAQVWGGREERQLSIEATKHKVKNVFVL